MSRKKKRRQSRGPAVTVVLLIILVGAGLAFTRLYPGFRKLRPRAGSPRAPNRTTTRPRVDSTPSARTLTARIYFARIVGGKERLAPVDREVSAEFPAQGALDELISGDLPAGCTHPLPEGTQLRHIRVENGTAIADFGRELVSNFQGGSDNEGVIVYAIVNTLTSLPGVKQAQILVDGRPLDSIGGHLDTSGPLAADGELVVR